MKPWKPLGAAAAVVLGCLFACGSARADSIVWDQSPEAIGGAANTGGWANVSGSQNFGERFALAVETELTAMDLYSLGPYPEVGKGVTIRIWADAGGGSPGALLYDFGGQALSIVDGDGVGSWSGAVRAFAVFSASVTLGPGTYLIGMSGTSTEIGLLAAQGGTGPLIDGSLARFAGTTSLGGFPGGDMAFRLYGTATSAVPEPGSLALLSVGVLGWTWMRVRTRRGRTTASGSSIGDGGRRSLARRPAVREPGDATSPLCVGRR